MELLSYLSTTPVPMADLTTDLRLTKQADTRTLIESLRSDGHRIITGDVEGMPGHHIWIDPAGWPKSKRAAEKWWSENEAKLLGDEQ